ncbi:MAG: hypothetical protein CMM06_01390 [Rhodopirellula sp.]|nr:hypothetical protein [Rhodopirellula sp.]
MNSEQPVDSASGLIKVGWFGVFLVIALSIYSAFVQRPAIASDVGTYLLATATSKAQNPVTLTSVDPQNLAEDRNSPITWWPESYSAIPAFVDHSANDLGVQLDGGQAIQWTTLLGWVIGTLLWYWFFKLVCQPNHLPWIVLIFLTARYSHANFYLYDGGEFFYWALFPAVLLLNYKAITHDQQSSYSAHLASLAGIATPMLVLLKYSAGLSTIGFGLSWLWMVSNKQVSKWSFLNWCVSVATISGFIFWLNLIPAGNPTQIDSPMQWTPILWITGAWLFAMTDLGTLLNKFTVDVLPAMGEHYDGSEGWLFAPAVVILWWLIKTQQDSQEPLLQRLHRLPAVNKLLIGHALGFSLALALLLIRGSAIHLDTRFLRPAAIAIMPMLIVTLWNRFSTTQDSKRKWLTFLVLLGLTVVPCSYGLLALGHKTFVRSQYATALTDGNGLRHDVLSPTGDAKAFFQFLNESTTTDDVIYIIEPTMGIPLNRRRLFSEEHAHLRTKKDLSKRVFQGSPKGQLYLPLPRALKEDGRAAAIQNSFIDINRWQEESLASQPDWVLLIGSPN